MIFLDETGLWVGMSRFFARSKKGQKAYSLRKFYKGRKLTLIGAISSEGVVAIKTIEGSMRGKDFQEFMKTDLIPLLEAGDVLVMDNLRAHKMAGIEEWVKARGASIEYLSPYSPEFNPIEMLWSVLKAFIRQFPSNSIRTLNQLINLGLDLMDKAFFKNWFIKCCYCAD